MHRLKSTGERIILMPSLIKPNPIRIGYRQVFLYPAKKGHNARIQVIKQANIGGSQ